MLFQRTSQMSIMAREKDENEPLQYVPAEEKKTVIEAPPREEPAKGKEGGEPERVPEKMPREHRHRQRRR